VALPFRRSRCDVGAMWLVIPAALRVQRLGSPFRGGDAAVPGGVRGTVGFSVAEGWAPVFLAGKGGSWATCWASAGARRGQRQGTCGGCSGARFERRHGDRAGLDHAARGPFDGPCSGSREKPSVSVQEP
jgi:hypothetical protein